ncbi:MAG: alpha/beta hydrolase [Deltaproteobacteria bacterium]|nr:alpha/beta hydrolase [Deltaproteobacteria bacterium]
MAKAVLQGVPVHYVRSGEGPDLFLVHGLAADLSFWYLRVVPKLSARWRVTVYDMRGHGFSGMPDSGYTPEDLAQELRALMDHLGIGSAHIGGHSFGGAVALQLALSDPERVRSLALFDVRLPQLQPLPPTHESAFWRERREALRSRGVEVSEETPKILYSLLEEIAGQTGKKNGATTGVPGFGSWKPGSRMARRWERLRDETRMAKEVGACTTLNASALTTVAQPVLLSFGERSRSLDTCKALEKCLPDHRTIIHPGVGHFFPAVRPDYVIEDLRPFLEEVEGSARGAAPREEGRP